jgi:hypothetical protein
MIVVMVAVAVVYGRVGRHAWEDESRQSQGRFLPVLQEGWRAGLHFAAGVIPRPLKTVRTLQF